VTPTQLLSRLGHELAHQSNRDFWHQKLAMSGTEIGLSTELRHNARQRAARYEIETKADEAGFTNASLAGFRTDKLISADNPNQSFLEYWADQTGNINLETHPEAADRSVVLRHRLAALERKVELFKYGVRLAHFGSYEDARELLLAFEREYPSREVLNNLGYVYLQLARQQMSDDLAFRFWFPTLLETNSGLNHLAETREWIAQKTLSEPALVALQTAQTYLQKAVRLDDSDIVSRANLIVVNLYLGKAGSARDLVDEAAAIKPGDTQIMGLRALVLYLQEPGVDTWERAMKILEPLSRLNGVDHNIVYNYSRLLKERGRDGSAKTQWDRLARHLSELPSAYQHAICRETNTPECDQRPVGQNHIQGHSFWKLPVKHGDDVESGASRKKLANWHNTLNTRVGTVSTRLYSSSNANTMLALDNKIELAVLKTHSFKSSEDLLSKMGKPRMRIPLAGGEIWSFDSRWSALVDRDEVQEIWISRP